MSYTAADVGKKMVDGVEVELSLAEREAKATRWNANVAAKAIKDADNAVRDARIAEIHALMVARTASLPDMQEFLLLKDA